MIIKDIFFLLWEYFQVPLIRPVFHFLKVVVREQVDFILHLVWYVATVPDNLSD